MHALPVSVAWPPRRACCAVSERPASAAGGAARRGPGGAHSRLSCAMAALSTAGLALGARGTACGARGRSATLRRATVRSARRGAVRGARFKVRRAAHVVSRSRHAPHRAQRASAAAGSAAGRRTLSTCARRALARGAGSPRARAGERRPAPAALAPPLAAFSGSHARHDALATLGADLTSRLAPPRRLPDVRRPRPSRLRRRRCRLLAPRLRSHHPCSAAPSTTRRPCCRRPSPGCAARAVRSRRTVRLQRAPQR